MKNKYPLPIMIIHWLTLFLVVLAYTTGGDPTVHLKTGELHVFAGISVFLLFLIRIIIISIYRKDIPLNKPRSKYQRTLFLMVKYTLYSLLFLIPVLGWVTLSGLTESYQLFAISLPLISNSWDVEIIGEVHEFLGNSFMVLIGFHALAALIHHYVFKDNVLKSMLYFKK
ncbi:cytochrome b [Acinetobacter sp. ANC 4173]|jgi:cytochrome b561|uniref:cytochrome b n=1 Tax=Acinetobacter sp. ANC 4173 TaxID=2529837 RepID=UPI00103A68BB|nr:cytochrome b/b6 domain-containing protein [Acinetobacter sp. ANC 4173]TCB82319.1 cytochrome b [Acinetobacter sp. ANC 4173]